MVTDHWYFLLHTKKRKFEVIDPSSSPFFSREKLLTNHVIFFFYWTTFGVVRLLCQKSWHTFDETFIHIENKSYFNSWSKNFFYVGFIYARKFIKICRIAFLALIPPEQFFFQKIFPVSYEFEIVSPLLKKSVSELAQLGHKTASV